MKGNVMTKSIHHWAPRFLATTLIILAATFTKAENNAKILASGHPDYPPFSWREGDAIVGAGADIAKLICGNLHVPCELKYEGDWKTVMKKAKNGDVAMIVFAYMNMGRFDYLEYSVPYAEEPIVVLVKKDRGFPLLSRSDLVGKKGIVNPGESYGNALDQYIKSKLKCAVIPVEKGLDLIAAGKADYMIAGKYQAMNLLKKLGMAGKIDILPNPISMQKIFITISKRSPFAKRLHDVNAQLKILTDDGTVKKLIEEWEKKWRENIPNKK